MFKPSPLMKIQLNNIELFGFILFDKFSITHIVVPATELTIQFNNPGLPQTAQSPDLTLDVAPILFSDGSLSCEGMGGLIFATSNINTEANFLDKVVNTSLSRLAGLVGQQLEQNEASFVELAKEEQQAMINGTVDQLTRVSEKLVELRSKMREAEPEAAQTQPTAVPADGSAEEDAVIVEAPAKKPATRKKSTTAKKAPAKRAVKK